MIDRAIEAIHERAAVIHSEALLTQIQSFGINDAQRCEALSGRDDLFVAWAIALVVRSEEVGLQAMVASAAVAAPTASELRHTGLRVQREWEEDEAVQLDRSWLAL